MARLHSKDSGSQSAPPGTPHLKHVLPAIPDDAKVLCCCDGDSAIDEGAKLDRVGVEGCLASHLASPAPAGLDPPATLPRIGASAWMHSSGCVCEVSGVVYRWPLASCKLESVWCRVRHAALRAWKDGDSTWVLAGRSLVRLERTVPTSAVTPPARPTCHIACRRQVQTPPQSCHCDARNTTWKVPSTLLTRHTRTHLRRAYRARKSTG